MAETAQGADQSGGVRVFVSSTFRDMHAERDALVKTAFPALRTRLRARGVELTEVDLRWGIDEAQSERGETLAICLREIGRSDVFLGLIGERYGWTPPPDALAGDIASAFPFVADAVGASVTELEIVHGVLNDAAAAVRALFFFRDPSYVRRLPPAQMSDFVETDAAARRRLDHLKKRIRASGAAIIDYSEPTALAPAVEAALGAVIDRDWPDSGAIDPAALADRLHAAYGRERRRLFVGAEARFAPLDAWANDPAAEPILLLEGASGLGKSALFANWLARRRAASRNDVVFEHYLAATPDSADPILLLRRLAAALARETGGDATIAAEPEALVRAIPERLAAAGAAAAARGGVLLIAFDALDKLTDQGDLRWLPEVLAPNVRIIATSLEGPAQTALLARNARRIAVTPLTRADQSALAVASLAKVGKALSQARLTRILEHPLATSPLFLLTLLNELRVFGAFDQLDARIDSCVAAETLPELFALVLARLEDEHGRDFVAQALSLIWAGRAGLEETDILAITGAPPVAWSGLSLGLGEHVRDADGRIAFAHDFMRSAVAARYLGDTTTIARRRLDIAANFLTRPADDARMAEEAPFQLREAGALERLHALLIDLDRFETLNDRGAVELHAHWRALAPLGVTEETALPQALAALAPDPGAWDEKVAARALAIAKYLGEAGARGDGLVRLLEQTVAAHARLFGETDQRTLRAMSPLAEALRHRGAFAEAQALNERLIAAATATLGGDHTDTLVYINNLGLTLMGKGDCAAALPHLEHVLEIERRVLTPDDRALLTAINNLAICRRTLGDYAGALVLQKEDVAARQRRFGRASPDTAASLYNLATTTELMGDAAAAMALHCEALDARIRSLGPVHPDTLISKHAVGLALMRKGNLVAARAIQEEVLAAFTALYGADHTDRLMALGNLGSTLYRLGETEVAHAMLVEVAEKRAASLGEEHPDTLLAQAALASTSGGAEGIALMQRTISTQARIFGDEHPATLERRAALVTMLYNSGAVADALALADQVYAARARVLGEAHPQVRSIAEQALTAAMTLQDPAQIEVQARRLLALCERSDALEHADALTAASALGAALVALNRAEEARVVLAPNLERLERIEGWSSRATFAGAWPLALARLQLGETEAAIALLARLDQAASAALGPDDPEVANYLTMHANARFNHGDYLEAARVFERVAAAYSAQNGESAPASLQAREHCATALAHGGELARALSVLEALHEARLAILGPQHDDVQRVAASIARVRAAMAAGAPEASAPSPEKRAPSRAARLWIAGAILLVIAAAIAFWSANHVAW